MSNQLLIKLMIFFQVLNSWIFFLEKQNIKLSWKTNKIKNKISLIFLFFLPLLTILSLLNKPL